MPSAFRRSLTRVLGFSPKDDLDLILPRFLPRTGDAVGDLFLANSVSCRLVTALEENSFFVCEKQTNWYCFFSSKCCFYSNMAID